jgi:hypothetical protein
MLFPVIKGEHRAYCGPVAVAALTGVPVAHAEKMIRRCRRGGYRDSAGRRIPIKGTYPWEVIKVMKRLGCKVTEMKNPEKTFGRFCSDTVHVGAAFLVQVTGHFMATYRGTFCDTAYPEPVPVESYPRSVRRVERAWRVEAPAVPRYEVVEKACSEAEPKTKPSISEVRAARVAASIKQWEAKRKRAETALRKLRKRMRYYERRRSGNPGVSAARTADAGTAGEAT